MAGKLGKKRKITFTTRLGFGFGGMLTSGALTFTHTYLVMFLSTQCGIPAGLAAAVSAAALWINAFLNPVIGFIGDNFYSTKIGRKFGRRRFWILIAIPLMIAEPLIFTVTPFGLPYYLVLYIVYCIAYSFCAANMAPLSMEMTDDFNERNYLVGFKHIFQNVAGFLMALLAGFGFGLFGENNPQSYFIIGCINAACMAASLIILYCSSWEHTPEEVAKEEIEGIGEGVKKLFADVFSTFRNRSFRRFLYAWGSTKIAAACWSACLSFFIVYALGITKSSEAMLEMPGKIVAMVFVGVWVAWLAKKGFHLPWYASCLGSAACIVAYNIFAALNLTGVSNTAISMVAYLAIFAIWKFFYIGFQYLPDVPFNYVPDIDELITLRRREGIYGATQNLFSQVASALSVTCWGFVLAASGFIKTAGKGAAAQVAQPITVPISICAYMLIGCAGFFILAAIFGKRLHIDKKECEIITNEVKRVREGGLMADVDPEVKKVCEDLSGLPYEKCFAHNTIGYSKSRMEPAK